jgi:hypothetical protein
MRVSYKIAASRFARARFRAGAKRKESVIAPRQPVGYNF